MAKQAKIQKIDPMLEDTCKCKKRHFDFGVMISKVCLVIWISFAPLARRFKFSIIWHLENRTIIFVHHELFLFLNFCLSLNILKRFSNFFLFVCGLILKISIFLKIILKMILKMIIAI